MSTPEPTLPFLPEDVLGYLREQARGGDARALALASEHGITVHPLGDVVWWADEALVWDTDGQGNHGWWSARAASFVDPDPGELAPLVQDGVLLPGMDPQLLAFSRDLYDAVRQLLSEFVLASIETNPRTGASYLQRQPQPATAEDLVELWRARHAVPDDDTPQEADGVDF